MDVGTCLFIGPQSASVVRFRFRRGDGGIFVAIGIDMAFLSKSMDIFSRWLRKDAYLPPSVPSMFSWPRASDPVGRLCLRCKKVPTGWCGGALFLSVAILPLPWSTSGVLPGALWGQYIQFGAKHGGLLNC